MTWNEFDLLSRSWNKWCGRLHWKHLLASGDVWSDSHYRINGFIELLSTRFSSRFFVSLLPGVLLMTMGNTRKQFYPKKKQENFLRQLFTGKFSFLSVAFVELIELFRTLHRSVFLLLIHLLCCAHLGGRASSIRRFERTAKTLPLLPLFAMRNILKCIAWVNIQESTLARLCLHIELPPAINFVSFAIISRGKMCLCLCVWVNLFAKKLKRNCKNFRLRGLSA